MHTHAASPRRIYFCYSMRVLLRLVGAIIALTLAASLYGLMSSLFPDSGYIAIAAATCLGLLTCERIERRIADAAIIVTASGIRMNWLITQRWYPWPKLSDFSATHLLLNSKQRCPLWPLVCLNVTLAELESGLSVGRTAFVLRHAIRAHIQQWPLESSQTTYLRPWTEGDREDFVRLFADEAVMEGHQLGPLSPQRAQIWYNEAMTDRHTGSSYVWRLALVHKTQGVIIGHIDIWLSHAQPGQCVIGYGVKSAWRRRGYAMHAVSTMISKLRQIPEVSGIQAHVLRSNEASRRLLVRVGFDDAAQPAHGERPGLDSVDGAYLTFTLSGEERLGRPGYQGLQQPEDSVS